MDMHSLTGIKHAYKTEFLPRKSFMLEKGDKNKKEKENSISKRLIYISIHKCTFQIWRLNLTVETGVAESTKGTNWTDCPRPLSSNSHSAFWLTELRLWGQHPFELADPNIPSHPMPPSPPMRQASLCCRSDCHWLSCDTEPSAVWYPSY